MKRIGLILIISLLIGSLGVTAMFAEYTSRSMTYNYLVANYSLNTTFRVGPYENDTAKARIDMQNPNYSNRVWIRCKGYGIIGDTIANSADSGYRWGEVNLAKSSVWQFHGHYSIDNEAHTVEYVYDDIKHHGW
jgi:hypothetical protein